MDVERNLPAKVSRSSAHTGTCWTKAMCRRLKGLATKEAKEEAKAKAKMKAKGKAVPPMAKKIIHPPAPSYIHTYFHPSIPHPSIRPSIHASMFWPQMAKEAVESFKEDWKVIA